MNQQYKAALETILEKKVNITERDLVDVFSRESARTNCLKNLSVLNIVKVNKSRYGYFDLNTEKRKEVEEMIDG